MRNLKPHFSDPIPPDLLVDICSRVPAKSIARFRCVSKSWASILRAPFVTEFFLTRSSTRLRLLLAYRGNGKFFFYTSPQPQNPDENSSLVATCYSSYSPRVFSSSYISSSLRGLVCLEDWIKDDKVQVIFNPVTRESITLPKVEMKGLYARSYLGYDPINKQFKLLCVTWSLGNHERNNKYVEHQILTLDTGRKLLWRTIECKPYYPKGHDMICLNGVLYYRADFEGAYVIVCFDVRSEKFSVINNIKELPNCHWTLINHKGKLGVLQYNYRIQKELVLWILEDVGESIWSQNVCALPYPWGTNGLYCVGMTSIGEIIVSPYHLSDPFHVFYYNPEKNTFKKINIQGFNIQRSEVYMYHNIDTFSDYIEDMNAM